ncbi:hypothetical protein ABBQ38_013973 [Trebouxia sp. C0009 RCD-2024]
MSQLESLCERLYLSQDHQERYRAEQYLRVFGQSAESVSMCKAILDSSRSPYAQLFAASSLVKVVTEQALSASVKLDMRQYFLQYLESHGAGLETFVTTSLIQLICRMTKLCWYDEDQYRKIVDDASHLLELGAAGQPGLYLLGLKLLSMLVSEMNQPTPGRTLTQHRKIAVAFRDQSLLKTFQISLAALKQLQITSAAETKLKEQAIALALACLSYDFVGTSNDDSSEDLGTIQVPSPWRPQMEDMTNMQLFFSFYSSTSPPLSSMALECLVRFASVRRSLFTTEVERSKFLAQLVAGTRDILKQQKGLAEHSNYHEFCRMLGRLKTNYQLSELVSVESYPEWIQLVADFTMKSLNSWQWASASIFYLMGLWSRLVSSMSYLKGDAPSYMETCVPKIARAYITSRLESVTTVLANSALDDPLENAEQLSEQMESLPYIFRFEYEDMNTYFCSVMDPIATAYSRGLVPGQDAVQLEVLEGQLTWLVHIIGAVIRGRLSSSTAESQETIDGDLAARAFGLLQFVDSGYHATRYDQISRQRLDIALLTVFQGFRKVYIGEQVMHSSKVYVRLTERLGIRDHMMVLTVMLTKICTNLKAFGCAENVIQDSLTLFSDLASGYMSGKLLQKLEAVHFMLQHHTSDDFGFLEEHARNRTIFYHTLSKLLFMEDAPSNFKSFVAPLQQVLVGLASTSSGATNAAALRQSVPQQTVVGVFRDLRGIALATNSRRTYGLLFDWLYPAHFPVISCCLEAWADTPEVTTALLRFMAEFVMNKNTRLAFDSSSPNGILLFREVSKVLTRYGQHILRIGQTSNPYSEKYKGIWLSLTVLTRALAGNYVNFGVFDLYGDPALKDALDVSLKMALSIPLEDIIAYQKVAKAYFGLMEVLCHSHVHVIAACDTATFAFLLSSLDSGLKSLDNSVCSLCAQAIDNLAGQYFKGLQAAADDKPNTTAQAISEHLRQRPELLPQTLSTLFEIVLFEDCSNQWSLSRPMLSLILLNEQIYHELKHRIIASQPAQKQVRLASCLDKLMTDVQRNLEAKNRDKFTQNLTILRHDFRAKT